MGVSQAGIQVYNDLCDRARKGRHPSKLPIEQAVLVAVRAEMGIQGATYEEERARKRRRVDRPVVVQPKMAEADALAMFEDEGDEEE